MNPFAISGILIVLTCGSLGYFVYTQGRGRPANRLWFLYTLSILVWGVFSALIALEDHAHQAILWWRIAFSFGIIWMPVLFYHFAYAYAPFNEKTRLLAAYIITALFSLSAFSEYFIPRVEFVFSSFYYARPGWIFYLMNAGWLFLTAYSHTKLYLASRGMPRERQNQIKYFIAASGIAYIGGFHDFSVVYGLNIYPWLNFLVPLYPIIMAYAIIKHGLFDIFIIIKRAVISAFLVGLVAWGIPGISALNAALIAKYDISPLLAPLLAGALAVYIGYRFLKAARLADRAKQEFITVAAHKLRTPLTHIRYIGESLLKEKTDAGREALVAQLKNSNEQLIGLVNKLLAVANLESRAEKYNFKPIDCAAIINTALDKTKALVADKKITISLNIASPAPRAEGDADNTAFAVQSILENAIIYTPPGGTIKIDLTADKRYVYCALTDSGIGIAKANLGKIFDKFYRAENALKTDTEGTGLALYMSRLFIKRQGGDMKVSSPGLGQGATLSFTLPAAKN